jgi:two-component system, LuxR family, sensor kinase FixL
MPINLSSAGLSSNGGFFNSSDFMPHGHCFLWLPDILWLHVLSDAGVAIAYLLIPFALVYFVHKRPDIPFQNVFLLFGAFILLCAITHLMSIWTLWHPDYAIEGVIKALTAIVSLATLFAIVKLLPAALKLPSPSQLQALNSDLIAANLELERLYTQSRESGQAQLRAVVDNVIDGLITIDETGKIVTVNPACARIFGYAAPEVIGRNISLLIPESDPEVHDGTSGIAHITDTTGREAQGQRKDASLFPIERSLSAFFLDGVRHYSGIIRDITERKKAEDALRQSQERYDLVVQGLSVGVWDMDIETRSIYWTQKFRDIIGIPDTSPTPSYDEASTRLHPDDQVRVRTALSEHAAGRGVFDLEYRMRYGHGEGRYIWVHGTGQCKRDEDGRPVRLVGSINDISERKAIELRLKEEVARVTAITNTMLDGLITIDEHGTVQTFNPAATRIFTYTPEEVIGHNVKMLMPEPYYTGHDGYLSHYMKTGEKKVIGIGREVFGRRKDASVFPMELSINEIEAEGMRLFVGTVRDITERKRSENALQLSRERYDMVLQGLSVGMWEWDVATNAVYWSVRFKEIIGVDKNEPVPEFAKTNDRLHPDDREATLGMIAAHIEHHTPFDCEYRLQYGDTNTYVWVHGTGQCKWDKEGNAVHMVGSVNDISERKEAEAAILDYVEKLKQSNQELDDFAYIASHDLKEPIRGLSNNAMFLSEDYQALFDEGGRKRLDRMVYLCKRMEALVDDLLYFSRLGRQELAVQATDLNAVVRDIELMMELTLSERNAEIVIPKPLPTIVCDLPRVTELLRNLITNAVKYNDKPQKRVEIGVAEALGRPDAPVFYVCDNGIGIETRFFDDIFRIFKRLNEEDDSAKGTGVGLTFVKKIIERHGGRIWLDSQPGQGTTFYFTLQLQEG